MNDVETRGSGTPILPENAELVKSETPLIDPLYACEFQASPSTASPLIHALPNMYVLRSNFLLKKLGPTASTTQPCLSAP